MEFDINAFVKSLDMDHIAVALVSIGLIILILSYWRLWHMFKKMGMAGWKCLIPIYSTWIVFKIIWKGSVFWFQLSIGIMVNLLPASDIPYKTLIGIIGIAVLTAGRMVWGSCVLNFLAAVFFREQSLKRAFISAKMAVSPKLLLPHTL